MAVFGSRGAAMRHILDCYHGLGLSRFGSPAYVRFYRGTFYVIPFGAEAAHEYTFIVKPEFDPFFDSEPRWSFTVYCSGPLKLPWSYD